MVQGQPTKVRGPYPYRNTGFCQFMAGTLVSWTESGNGFTIKDLNQEESMGSVTTTNGTPAAEFFPAIITRAVKRKPAAALDLGPLEPLLDDPSISDILVNGTDAVYVERGGRLDLTEVRFEDEAELMSVIQRIASSVGRRVDELSPLVDARLPDGSRVNAAIPPVTIDGPALSIRRFGRKPITAEMLVDKAAMTKEMLQILQACVQSRLNIVVSGGAGSGKTTMLNALSGFISDRERIITIEDAAELRLQQRHVVRMETRPPNAQGEGAVHIRQLLVNALRMRPDRIIVGEVRSEEALDMLQAMNTGHDGSLSTIHANSPRDALGRLEVMVGMANPNLGIRNMRQQIVSATHMIVQMSRLSDGTRRVTNITECLGMEGDVVTLQDLFVFERTGLTADGKITGRFRGLGLRPKCWDKMKACGIEIPLAAFSATSNV
jgi:pilus assembly protein CpaF